jgi:hypothetical protein
VPAIREAIRDPLLTVPAGPLDVAALVARTADAWLLWHQSTEHRTDVGRILPRLVTDARIAARTAEGQDRRAANAVLADAKPGTDPQPERLPPTAPDVGLDRPDADDDAAP